MTAETYQTPAGIIKAEIIDTIAKLSEINNGAETGARNDRIRENENVWRCLTARLSEAR